MPICRTCRGEYMSSETLCPSCRQPLGRRNLNLCHHCGAQTGGRRLCPRCHSDVSVWEQEATATIFHFILLRGGWVGLLPSLLQVLLWGFVLRHAGFYNLISTGIGIAFSLILFRILYIKRLFWRERFWASQIYRQQNPPLLSITLVTLSSGILLLVLWFILYTGPLANPQTTPQKLLLALPSILGFIGLTIGLTLFVIQSYLDQLDEKVPQPLFVHTERLLEVVLRSADQSIKDGESRPGAPANLERFDVLQIVRTPADGGIRVWLTLRRPPGAAAKDLVTFWVVDADRWGRIRCIKRSTTTEEALGSHSHTVFGL